MNAVFKVLFVIWLPSYAGYMSETATQQHKNNQNTSIGMTASYYDKFVLASVILLQTLQSINCILTKNVIIPFQLHLGFEHLVFSSKQVL